MEELQWKRGNHELAQKKMDERLAKTRGVAGAPGSKEPLPTKKFQLKKMAKEMGLSPGGGENLEQLTAEELTSMIKAADK